MTQLNAGNGSAHRLPQFLPDGRRFLFSAALGTADTNGTYVGSLDKTPPVRVLPDETGGRFAAPDKLLTIKQGALQAYTFDPASGAVQGEPTVIAQGFAGAAAIPGFTVSDNGVLAYRIGAAQRRQLVWVSRQGSVLSTIGDPDTDYIASPELSPDEKSVVVFLQRTGDNDIWVIELPRNLARRITDGPPADAHPLWDPDGRYVVFSSQRFGGGSPARQPLDRWGGGATVQEPPERASRFPGRAIAGTSCCAATMRRRVRTSLPCRWKGSRARWPWRSHSTTKRKGSSRRTAGGSHSSPPRAAVRKCSSSRSLTRGGERRSRRLAARRSAGPPPARKSSTSRRTAG